MKKYYFEFGGANIHYHFKKISLKGAYKVFLFIRESNPYIHSHNGRKIAYNSISKQYYEGYYPENEKYEKNLYKAFQHMASV